MILRPLRIAATGLVCAVGLVACAGGDYADTPLPTASSSATSSTSASSTSTAPVECDDPTQSYDPLASVPASSSISDSGMKRIVDRGYLLVGVSADTLLLGARNPLTSRIEGFDIDLATAVAKRIFGDRANSIRLRVITAADRIPLLEDGSIDMVARNMTMTCARWQQINFSSEYYHAGQKVLVARDSDAVTLEDLVGQRVCAPKGTSSLDNLSKVEGIEIVTSDNHTGCLVLFQQGQAEAITGDDTVLAGLAAQDPYAEVTEAEAISDEPYGLGVAKSNVFLTRYINAVLDDLRASGEWTAIYNRWLADTLGKAPKPPTPVYGR